MKKTKVLLEIDELQMGVSNLESNYKEYALFMKALGDETRLKIFHMLSGGELCACKILEEFHITQPTLSYHMKTLCESGLVNGRRDGIWTKYSINEKALEALKMLFNDIDVKTAGYFDCSTEC